MPVTVQELESVALQLAPEERARLAQRLIASLEEEAEVESAWVREAQKRSERYRDGHLETVLALLQEHPEVGVRIEGDLGEF